MRVKFYACCLAVLLPATGLISVALAQTSWWKTFGGTDDDNGSSVQQTADGGFIVAGWTRSFGAGSSDVYLVKTDAHGETLWTKTYGGFQFDVGYCVQQTADSGYIVTGYTYSYGEGGDVYLIRTDAQGDALWTRTYGGTRFDLGHSVRQTADGGYVIAGLTYSYGEGNTDVYLVKTDAQGDTLWTRTYGGPDVEYGFSVQQTVNSGYVVAGYTSSFGAGNEDVYLVKTDAWGETLWTRTYGGTNDDAGNSVQQTFDSGYVIAGWTESFGAESGGVYLVKTSVQGDTLWTRVHGGTNDDGGSSVQQTEDGGYVVAGWTNTFGAGDYDVYLIKTDAHGDTLWTRTCGGTSEDAGQSTQRTTDSCYVIAGYVESFGAGSSDVYLIKTDAFGNVGMAKESYERQRHTRRLATTIVRSLPQDATAFDVMGAHVLRPQPGIYFVRTTATAVPQKVLLVD